MLSAFAGYDLGYALSSGSLDSDLYYPGFGNNLFGFFLSEKLEPTSDSHFSNEKENTSAIDEKGWKKCSLLRVKR